MKHSNKSMIALAVLGLCAAPAMAEGGNVQMYGSIDIGVARFSGVANGSGGTGSATQLSSGVQTPSIIGFKGFEPLGNGLFAAFDVETGFCATGNNTIANKDGTDTCSGGGFMQSQSWAALKSPYGTLAGGRAYTGMRTNEASVDPFADGLTGSAGNLSLISQYGLQRVNQGLAYVTPDWNGWSGSVAYSFAPGAGGDLANPKLPSAVNVTRSSGLRVGYAHGPVTAGLAWSEVTNVRLKAWLDPVSGVNDGNLSGWQIYGAYDFGLVKLSAEFIQSQATYAAGNARTMMLGASVPLGAGHVLLSWNRAQTDYGMRYDNTSNAASLSTPIYGNATQWALGYTYALSKRTDLYASWAQITNSAHTNFTVGSASDAFTGVMGQNSSGMAIGIRHAF